MNGSRVYHCLNAMHSSAPRYRMVQYLLSFAVESGMKWIPVFHRLGVADDLPAPQMPATRLDRLVKRCLGAYQWRRHCSTSNL